MLLSRLRGIAGRIAQEGRALVVRAEPYWALLQCELRWPFRALLSRAHPLARELVVSLTSYPPRFPTLIHTLKCLLSQSVRPDRVVLWISPEDRAAVPIAVQRLQGLGLEIRSADNLGPYKKIVPALEQFPEAIIVTADDDICYEPKWLEQLIGAWNGQDNQIACHRAHEIVVGADGKPTPYAEWKFNSLRRAEALDLLPTCGRGALFPPGSLAPEVTEKRLFMELCPGADDIWLYWMGRRAGSTYKLVKNPREVVTWPGSQHVTLHEVNLRGGGNDQKIKAMISRFGFPDSELV